MKKHFYTFYYLCFDDFIGVKNVQYVFKRLQESISALRSQLSSAQTGEEAQQLNFKRDELAQKVQHFRVQLTEAQAIRRKQLTKLTVQSSDATKKLQEIVAMVCLLLPHLIYTQFI